METGENLFQIKSLMSRGLIIDWNLQGLLKQARLVSSIGNYRICDQHHSTQVSVLNLLTPINLCREGETWWVRGPKWGPRLGQGEGDSAQGFVITIVAVSSDEPQ
jgi:hypothetical protein